MAVLSGKEGSATVGGTAITHLASWEIDYKGDAIDVTGMSESGKKAFIGGLTEWSGSMEFALDGGLALPTPATSVSVSLVDSADTGYNTYAGTAVITGVKPSTSVDGAVKCSVSFQGSGTLSIS
jgi:predicted secreted protein